ncbi:hypothetical protein AB434_2562 [Heyndrickxia coagulans]|uniref:Uncharacterized protein n=1 Tax=Heyndrickxia coagulans TaxID=1398 RepID=A0AAN0WCW5_HEYCO|nr:hypothetical protein SB48_HM08orf04367 [Heyndrickxia coagulans]AKN54967.1 hypothetical protein AB434_2562 [Heyndrickxia coagulans]KYC90429.1 hypothetical protein B4096_0093 [Heyndrickxia coagulans]
MQCKCSYPQKNRPHRLPFEEVIEKIGAFLLKTVKYIIK